MPDISLPAHPFDLVFHPVCPTVYTGLLTGHIHAYSYDTHGTPKRLWSLRPSKKSCRCLSINDDGAVLWAGGKGRQLITIDTLTGQISDTRAEAHKVPINRIKHFIPWLVSTGDDDGVIKFWDPRRKDAVRTYTQHFDYITDFLWLDDKKHLVATSGDGTLSVIDVRSKKAEPYAQSEDQEDELLSIVAIQGGSKIVVGTQLGILSIFNRKSGWGDCVDRVPGHPQSIDALLTLPPSFSNANGNTILTGSSDGYVRAVDILPTKLLGVVADHGDFPVERMAIGNGGGAAIDSDAEEVSTTKRTRKRTGEAQQMGSESEDSVSEEGAERWWLGSVGHDELLRLTDLSAFFAKLNEGMSQSIENDVGEVNEKDGSNDDGGDNSCEDVLQAIAGNTNPAASDDSDSDRDESIKQNKRKRKREKKTLIVNRKKGRNEVEVDGSFFAEL